MNRPTARFYFDYVDPLSYVTELELRQAESTTGVVVERVPLELRAPPEEMVDPDDPLWADRLREARLHASTLGIDIADQVFIPWTRKAHEFVRHARANELGPQAHDLVFESVFTEGLDVGRVDVLVGLSRRLELDASGTKAVLDVDRYTQDVVEAREAAMATGVTQVPTLLAGSERLEGFHNRGVLSTFLHATPRIT